MSVEHSLLGKDTQYPTQYQPNNMHILKGLLRAKIGGMYLKFHG